MCGVYGHRRLAEQGELSDEQLAQAGELRKKTGIGMVAALLALGHIAPDDVAGTPPSAPPEDLEEAA